MTKESLLIKKLRHTRIIPDIRKTKPVFRKQTKIKKQRKGARII